MKFGAGQPVLRIEDNRLLRGEGCYVDDIAAPNALHMAVLRSPYAHARILSVRTARALAMPGVIAVATGEDLAASGLSPIPILRRYQGADGEPMKYPPRWPLARSYVRHVGEPVAAVVAVSAQAAQDALEGIQLDAEEQEATVDLVAASAPGSPLVWPGAGSNAIVSHRVGDRGAVDAAFARASKVVELSVLNQRVSATPLEPRAVLAAPAADDAARMVLHTATQNPAVVHEALTKHVFQWPDGKLRVRVHDIGGSFGMKGYLYPEDVLVLWFSERLCRTVRWVASRSEEFMGSTHARDQLAKGALAFDAAGRILGLRLESWTNLGAYPAPAGPLLATVLGSKVITNVYDIPEVDIEAHGLLTHTQPTAPYRGAGRPEAIYFIERLMDKAASSLAIDRIELRRRNLIQRSQIPYRTATGEVYDSGNFKEILDRALAEADWSGFEKRRAESAKSLKLRGLGIAMFVEWTGAHAYEETADIVIRAGGTIEVISATQPMGQGLETTFAQMVGDAFDVNPASIAVVTGDTDRARGFGSFGSRSLIVGGSAIAVAAHAAFHACRALAAEYLEASLTDIDYEAARFRVVGTDREIGLFELAAQTPEGRIVHSHTNEIESGSWPNGAYVCEVEIDSETGSVALQRLTCVDDVGVAINPMIVEGQIQGGAAQGVGQALMEEVLYEPATGQLITGSFQDYCMPRAKDLPKIDAVLDERWPCLTNPLGSKGAGESGTVGAAPAVISAVVDALRQVGVDDIDMPATPARIWERLRWAIKSN